MSDIVERLRFELRDWTGSKYDHEMISVKLVSEAADEIARLRAENERLRGSLEDEKRRHDNLFDWYNERDPDTMAEYLHEESRQAQETDSGT